VHGWSFHEHMPARRRQAYITLERLAAKFTGALVAVTRRDVEKGLQAGIGRPEQYRLIRSAIPVEVFDPQLVDRRAARRELGLPLEAPVLGNVGRFSPQKNPLDWVAVAARVARALPEGRFLLAGDGPLRSEVEAHLAAEGLAERTVLAGLRRDVPRMLAAMDVFLLTSLWEGLPRVIPQALLMNLPVVAYGVDGSSEAVQPGDTGYVCPPGALDEAAARCLELLRDPARRREMGRRGRAYALEEFDLRVMVQQIESLYNELLMKR
jgi:glycosyltransferase involved in cell wall biosynthesis